MELFEAIEKRCSCRNLKPVDIPREHIKKILDAGRRAPSGMNKQPYELLAVTDKSAIEKIAEAQAFIKNASAVIMIAADPDVSRFWLEDISAVTENMLLAITGLGYASTWVEGKVLPKEAELKKYFGVPDRFRLIIALPVGRPDEKTSQATKRPLEKIVHWQKW